MALEEEDKAAGLLLGLEVDGIVVPLMSASGLTVQPAPGEVTLIRAQSSDRPAGWGQPTAAYAVVTHDPAGKILKRYVLTGVTIMTVEHGPEDHTEKIMLLCERVELQA
jgi:hypothetical protein